MRKQKAKEKTRSAVSLFSGVGGFDIGFQRLGFQTLYAADFEESAVAGYNRNLEPVAQVYDLTAGLPARCRRLRPQCVFAGPPCQGFSVVGKRDPDDPRSNLLPHAGKLAIELTPSVIVIENVPGVRVGPPAKHWTALIQLLRHAGYNTHDILCDARTLGLAQSRRRILLFAWRANRQFPELSHNLTAGRLDTALAGVENLPDHSPKPLEPNSKLFRIAQRIGPGQKLCNVRGGVRSVHTWHIPEVFGTTSAIECELLESIMRLRRQERRRDVGDADPVSLERLTEACGKRAPKVVARLLQAGYLRKKGGGLDLAHTFNGKFRRLRWDDAACTVDTRFGDPHLFLHPNENRPFSAREAARIQGFPDNYDILAQTRDSFRLVGNAVPPPMGEFAAQIALKLI